MELKESIGLNEDARKIRETVFVKEQGFTVEFDETDCKARHFVMYDGVKAIGCCRAFCEDDPKTYHIGRVAVLAEMRGKGIGLRIIEETEKILQKDGAEKVILSAQVRVKPFYEKLGYHAEGEIYYDEFCEHINMAKEL